MNFLSFKFNIHNIKAGISLDKFKRIIKRIENNLKKNSLSNFKMLQSFVDLLSFATKSVFLNQVFYQCSYNVLVKVRKYLY